MDVELSAKQLTEYFDRVPTKDSVDNLLSSIKGIEAKLADVGKPADKMDDQDEAELEAKAGFLGGIMDFKIWGVPIGGAAVGGFVSVVATELIDGFMLDSEPWKKGLAKAAVAVVAVKWGKKILGDTGSKTVAALLAFDAIRDMTPIDSWAKDLANKITGNSPAAGLASHKEELERLRSFHAAQVVDKPVVSITGSKSYYSNMLSGGH